MRHCCSSCWRLVSFLDADGVPGIGLEPDTGLPPFPYDEVDRQVMYDDLLNIEDPIADERGLDALFGGSLSLLEVTTHSTSSEGSPESAPDIS